MSQLTLSECGVLFHVCISLGRKSPNFLENRRFSDRGILHLTPTLTPPPYPPTPQEVHLTMSVDILTVLMRGGAGVVCFRHPAGKKPETPPDILQGTEEPLHPANNKTSGPKYQQATKVRHLFLERSEV